MIYINKNYLNRFKKIYNEYMYPLQTGIYLAFSESDLHYIGIEMYCTPYNKKIYQKEDMLLNELLSKGLLESR